jgi:hypothetical protein
MLIKPEKKYMIHIKDANFITKDNGLHTYFSSLRYKSTEKCPKCGKTMIKQKIITEMSDYLFVEISSNFLIPTKIRQYIQNEKDKTFHIDCNNIWIPIKYIHLQNNQYSLSNTRSNTCCSVIYQRKNYSPIMEIAYSLKETKTEIEKIYVNFLFMEHFAQVRTQSYNAHHLDGIIPNLGQIILYFGLFPLFGIKTLDQMVFTLTHDKNNLGDINNCNKYLIITSHHNDETKFNETLTVNLPHRKQYKLLLEVVKVFDKFNPLAYYYDVIQYPNKYPKLQNQKYHYVLGIYIEN